MAINYLQRGAELLQQRMEKFAGLTVTYTRPNLFSFDIVAVPGRNPVELVDQNGVVLKGQSQDFTFSIAEMKSRMTNNPKTPMRGDEIKVSLPFGIVFFTVNGDGFSASHYTPSDSYGIAWRVHTKVERYA